MNVEIENAVLLIAAKYPTATLSGNCVTVQPPRSEPEYETSGRFWLEVFQYLYSRSVVVLPTLAEVAFWHVPTSNSIAPPLYKSLRGWIREHLPSTIFETPFEEAQTLAYIEPVEVQLRDVLILGGGIQMPQRILSLLVSGQEYSRVRVDGLVARMIGPRSRYDHRIEVPVGAIHQITFAE